MILIGARGQQVLDDYYDYDGTIATGGSAQLALPRRKSCSHLIVINNSTGLLMIQFGVRRAVATLTNGGVTGVSVPDAGFGFVYTPVVYFGGGGIADDPTQGVGVTMPDWPSPFNPASGRAVMSTSALGGLQISSISIDSGGTNYTAPPYVFIRADRRDATGVGIPSATAGFPIQANGGSYYVNGTSCPTSAISIWGATTGQSYAVKWMP